jgi:hypothetical protein
MSDAIGRVMSEGMKVLFAHYFVESRVGGLKAYVGAREFIVPDKRLSSADVWVFTGHDHRSWHSENGKVHVIGSLLPRDVRLGGKDISLGVWEVDNSCGTYKPISISLPYALYYNFIAASLNEFIPWVKEKVTDKDIIVVSKLIFTGGDRVTRVDVERALNKEGIDHRKIIIRQIDWRKKRDNSQHIVDMEAIAGMTLKDAFQKYLSVLNPESIPENITKEDIAHVMEDILSLWEGDSNA